MSVAPLPISGPSRREMSTRELAEDILKALLDPAMVDMRRRCALAAAACGAPSKAVEAILAVPLVVPGRTGVDE